MRPDTTGDTANGESIIVTSKFFPGNENRVMVKAAVIPNRVFKITDTTETLTVSPMAKSAYSLVMEDQYLSNPSEKASEKTV
jgi:hypothetical protein